MCSGRKLQKINLLVLTYLTSFINDKASFISSNSVTFKLVSVKEFPLKTPLNTINPNDFFLILNSSAHKHCGRISFKPDWARSLRYQSFVRFVVEPVERGGTGKVVDFCHQVIIIDGVVKLVEFGVVWVMAEVLSSKNSLRRYFWVPTLTVVPLIFFNSDFIYWI